MTKKENIQEEADIRIEFYHHNLQKRILRSKSKYPIQSVPFVYGLKITNIGNTVFPGAIVKEFKIKFDGSNSFFFIPSKPQIKPLNPGEKIKVELDQQTSFRHGPGMLELTLKPLSDKVTINTYQYDSNHKTDNKNTRKNKWINQIFFQSELELLQSRTNQLILLLTAITVVEGVFGLKYSAQQIFKLMSIIFTFMSNFFSILGGST